MTKAGEKDRGDGLDLSVLTEKLGFRLHMLDVEIMRSLAERCARHDLTPASASVLMIIKNNPGVRHGELADALLIQRPNMTKLMKRLEAGGFLRRLAAQGDRRRVVFALTAKAAKAVAAVSEKISGDERRFRAALGAGGAAFALGLDALRGAVGEE